jgi:hypothetical protein
MPPNHQRHAQEDRNGQNLSAILLASLKLSRSTWPIMSLSPAGGKTSKHTTSDAVRRGDNLAMPRRDPRSSRQLGPTTSCPPVISTLVMPCLARHH